MTRTAEDQTLIDQLNGRAEAAEQEVSRLRHDLRGILSPTLLLADRLSMSDDPIAQRTAAAIISTIERAEAALAKKG